MDQIEILKKAPKEHYTLHNNKLIKVGELLKLLTEKENKKKNKK